MLGANKNGTSTADVATILGSWKDHYNFWTKKNDNLLLIKYEDILLNPNQELSKIKEFINKFIKFKTNDIKDKNIINSTSFKYLKKLEENGEFTENVFDKISRRKIKFFNQGPDNKWQNYLDDKTRLEIETKLFVEMKELGYL